MRKSVFEVYHQVRQTKLLEAMGLEGTDCTIYAAKTKALISCRVIMQLVCIFVFAYAKTHNAAHFMLVAI